MQPGSTLPAEQQPESITSTSLETLARHIGILQQIQRLLSCAGQPEATLADMTSFLASLQQEYGFVTPLEEIIQTLVGQHLLLQYQVRQSHRTKVVA